MNKTPLGIGAALLLLGGLIYTLGYQDPTTVTRTHPAQTQSRLSRLPAAIRPSPASATVPDPAQHPALETPASTPSPAPAPSAAIAAAHEDPRPLQNSGCNQRVCVPDSPALASRDDSSNSDTGWQARVDLWLAERDALRNSSSLSAQDRSASIEQARHQHFSAGELARVQEIEQMHDRE